MPASRRRFIEVFPLLGSAAWLAACFEQAPPPQPAPLPAPAPAPSPAPAPVADAGPPPVPAAPAGGPVDEKEPAAVALGYVVVARRADTTRFKSYTAGQACANCALFGGRAGDATGPCPLFAGRSVAATGWCSGYTRKPD